jgi:hypothetical protein
MYKSLNKTQLKLFLREEIDKIGVCSSIKNNCSSQIYDMFLWAFERHPKYPDKFHGMTDIMLKYNYNNPFSKSYLEVHIIREDGTTEDVSVMKSCITGIPKNNLYIAMRNSIIPQILDYKNNNILLCSKCGSSEKIEVDHHIIDFIELFESFLDSQQYIPNKYDDNLYHSKVFKKEDSDFENNWINYHKNNAILQFLCKSCNNSKPKKHIKNPKYKIN